MGSPPRTTQTLPDRASVEGAAKRLQGLIHGTIVRQQMGEVVLFESLALIQGLFRGAVQRANLDSKSAGERRKARRRQRSANRKTSIGDLRAQIEVVTEVASREIDQRKSLIEYVMPDYEYVPVYYDELYLDYEDPTDYSSNDAMYDPRSDVFPAAMSAKTERWAYHTREAMRLTAPTVGTSAVGGPSVGAAVALVSEFKSRIDPSVRVAVAFMLRRAFGHMQERNLVRKLYGWRSNTGEAALGFACRQVLDAHLIEAERVYQVDQRDLAIKSCWQVAIQVQRTELVMCFCTWRHKSVKGRQEGRCTEDEVSRTTIPVESQTIQQKAQREESANLDKASTAEIDRKAVLETQRALETKVHKMSQQQESLREELRQSNSQQETLREELRQSNSQQETLREELRQSNSQQETLREELRHSRLEASRLDQQDAAGALANDVEARLENQELRAMYDKSRKECEQLRSQLLGRQSEDGDAVAALQVARKQISALTEEEEKNRGELVATKQEVAKLKAKYGTLEDEQEQQKAALLKWGEDTIKAVERERDEAAEFNRKVFLKMEKKEKDHLALIAQLQAELELMKDNSGGNEVALHDELKRIDSHHALTAEMLQVQLEKLARDVRSREQGVNAHISDEDCKVWMDTLQRVQLQIRQTDPSVKTAAATREAWMEELRHIHNSIIEKVMAQRLATL